MKKREYAILEALPNPVFFKDFEGRFQYCNKAFYEFLGADENEIIGKKADEIGLDSVAERFREADEALLRGEGVQVYEAKVADYKGELRDLQITKNLVYSDEIGELIGIAGVVVDITERVNFAKKMKGLNRIKDIAIQINQRLLDSDEETDTIGMLLEKSIESISNAKFGAILLINENGFLEMPKSKGYPKQMTKNFKVRLEDSLVVKSKGQVPKEICVIRDIDKMKAIESPELLVLDGDSVKTSLVSPIWIDGELYGFINIDSTKRTAFDMVDIEIMEYMRDQIQTVLTKQRKYQKKLMSMRTDPVTGLINRKYLIEMIQKAMDIADVSSQKMSLVMMDIDGMKRINDSFGHLAGDSVLKAFGRSVLEKIRDCDIIGRFGGDEFIAIFQGSGGKMITAKMEEIRELLEHETVHHGNAQLHLNFSFGVSEYPRDGQEIEALVTIADAEMYADKRRRKENRH